MTLDPIDARIWAEREVALRREIAALHADAAAKEKALFRATQERDHWRSRYLDMVARVEGLLHMQRELRAVSTEER